MHKSLENQGFLLVLRVFSSLFRYYNVAYEVKSFCTIVIPFKIKPPLNPTKQLTVLHRIRYDKGARNSSFHSI